MFLKNHFKAFHKPTISERQKKLFRWAFIVVIGAEMLVTGEIKFTDGAFWGLAVIVEMN